MPDLKKNTKSKFGLSEKTIALLRDAFRKFPEVKKVKIFGSRAMGNYRPGSDIDLAVFADALPHNTLINILRKIEDLELLYEIDCLDYNKIDNPELREHIDVIGKTFFKAELK